MTAISESKKDKVRKEAMRLITSNEDGHEAQLKRAISWHIRLGTGLPTSQVNYYMRKMCKEGLFVEDSSSAYSVIYKLKQHGK